MSVPADNEITVMRRIIHDLASLHPGARHRVMAYVLARIEALPVIAAVGGGTEEGEAPSSMFDDVPQMPPLKGAAA
jgi:hypothetical protein